MTTKEDFKPRVVGTYVKKAVVAQAAAVVTNRKQSKNMIIAGNSHNTNNNDQNTTTTTSTGRRVTKTTKKLQLDKEALAKKATKEPAPPKEKPVKRATVTKTIKTATAKKSTPQSQNAAKMKTTTTTVMPKPAWTTANMTVATAAGTIPTSTQACTMATAKPAFAAKTKTPKPEPAPDRAASISTAVSEKKWKTKEKENKKKAKKATTSSLTNHGGRKTTAKYAPPSIDPATMAASASLATFAHRVGGSWEPDSNDKKSRKKSQEATEAAEQEKYVAMLDSWQLAFMTFITRPSTHRYALTGIPIAKRRLNTWGRQFFNPRIPGAKKDSSSSNSDDDNDEDDDDDDDDDDESIDARAKKRAEKYGKHIIPMVHLRGNVAITFDTAEETYAWGDWLAEERRLYQNRAPPPPPVGVKCVHVTMNETYLYMRDTFRFHLVEQLDIDLGGIPPAETVIFFNNS